LHTAAAPPGTPGLRVDLGVYRGAGRRVSEPAQGDQPRRKAWFATETYGKRMGISVTASVLIMEYRGRPLQAPHLLRRGHLHPGAPHPRLAQPAAAEQCLAPHAVPPQPLLAPTTPAAQHGSLQPPAASTPARPLARVSPAHARSQRRSEGGCCSAWLAGGTCGDVGAAHAPQTPARAAAAAARRPAARSSWIYSVTRTGVTWVNTSQSK
jgi:hypothetical protein